MPTRLFVDHVMARDLGRWLDWSALGVNHAPQRESPTSMRLLFADGTTFAGRSFGASRSVRGEVVFHTGMVGYVEALTDPSYRGQLLALTYPLQGNYGVPDGPFESAEIQVHGLIVHRHAESPSHWTSRRSLGNWLKRHGVPAIEGVDVRSLTRYLRAGGTLDGQLVLDEGEGEPADRSRFAKSSPVVDMPRVLDLVTLDETVEIDGGELRILLVDTGTKESIGRSLHAAGASVVRVPWHHGWDRHLDDVDGVVLANGPGNPSRLAEPVNLDRIRQALRRDLPVFGICLGHQWLAQAVGGTVYKMQYGHRSHNQPVLDLTTRRAYLTTQNHGYAVDVSRLAADFEPWFTNLNDGSNEGIRHRHKPFRSVQFHPEAAAGPRDTRFMFDDFLRTAGEVKVQRAVHPR